MPAGMFAYFGSFGGDIIVAEDSDDAVLLDGSGLGTYAARSSLKGSSLGGIDPLLTIWAAAQEIFAGVACSIWPG
jgi:hypothetical protein